jgi:putative ABC transport system permease protein
MGVLIKIAYRNLREHLAKTLIIGSLIAVGLIVLVTGNSLIGTAEAGVRRLYSDNFTGDVMIASTRSASPGLFMSAGTKIGEPIPVIQDYRRLMDELGKVEGVAATVSQIKGFATAEIDGQGAALLQLFGVDPEEYVRMFPRTIEVIEGRFLRGDEGGIVLSDTAATMLEESSGRDVRPGAKILLTSVNAVSGTKIREVEIRGIARFPSQAPNLDFVSYVDLVSLRVLSGMTKVTDVAAELTTQEQSLLGVPDESRLFGEGLLAESNVATSARGEAELLAILGDTSEAALYRELDPEAFHHVLLALEADGSPQRMIAQLNRRFAQGGLAVKAYGWVAAAGGVAQMVSALKVVFNALVIVVAIVAVIIIMNTLVISITERIGEIGTMRAIGAGRAFVRGMITLETLIISLVFGLAGTAVGWAVLAAVAAAGIETSSVFLQVLFGGPVLRPVVNPGSIALNLLVIPAIGILASLYPVSVALRIEPVTAMGQR